MKLQIIINKPPTPKQSFRMGNGHGYLPAKVQSYIEIVTQQTISQLPDDFEIIRCPMTMEIEHWFPYTGEAKRLIKKNKWSGDGGNPKIIKSSRPDVTDNLNKGIIDAMQGWVFVDDALIWNFSAKKVYAEKSCSIVRITTNERLLIEDNALFRF